MKEKINIARKILSTNCNNKGKQSIYLERLRDITEKAELIYNDVIVKKKKCKSALQTMRNIEHEMDVLLKNKKQLKD